MNLPQNLLPSDGEVLYHPSLLSSWEAQGAMHALLSEIPWRSDELRFFGKIVRTRRQMAWFADDGLSYSYSGTTKRADTWTPGLSAIRSRVEAACECSFNACLANLYHDGSDGMSWHSDDEKSIEPDSPIASISLGAERKFRFKHKRSGDCRELRLQDGSLLLMRGTTQTHWLHCLPKTKRVTAPRINLTFRKMVLPAR